MANYPSLNGLIDFLRGLFHLAERGEVETRMSCCRLCEEEQNWLDEVTATAATDQSFDFSEETIAQVVDQFKAQAPHTFSDLRRLKGVKS